MAGRMVRYAEPGARTDATACSRRAPAHRAAFLLTVALLGGCKEESPLVAPPTPRIAVARPLQQLVTPYLEATGNAVAVASVDLVARVPGYLVSIGYRDGAFVKRGDLLFQIDPTEYQAKLQQAQANLENSQAQLVQAERELQRQVTLGRDSWAAQSTVDQQRAQRDGLRATIRGQEAGVTLAQLDLSYTRVTAPFDGVVTAHLFSVGSLVGVGGPTTLATLVQVDPIYASFTISEQDALQIRARMAAHGRTARNLDHVPVEAGLMTEEGYPHRGRLDYITPQFDTATGTITVRAVFENAGARLIPGAFLRLRIPMGEARTALLVPDQALGTDQGGRYVLVLDQNNTVQQRRVRTGQLVGTLRVIETGLEADDRVVVNRLQRAVPGSRIEPQTVELTPTGAISTASAASR